MDQVKLDEILNAPEEKAAVDTNTSTTPESTTESTESTATTETKKSEVVVDPDLQWDDEGSPAPDEDEEKAPDGADEDELKAIEEKNKWMKGRLAPTKEKLTKAEQEIAKLRQELDAVKAGKPADVPPEANANVAPANTIDEFINQQPVIVDLQSKLAALKEQANKGEITEIDYVDQRTDLLSDIKIAKREISQAIKSQQQQVQQYEAKIEKDFNEAVLSKKEEYPDIEKAYNRVLKNVGNLDVNIRAQLIFEGDKINPFAGDLVNIIGNDKQAMGYLIAQSKLSQKNGRPPVGAIEYIGRLKARIEAEKAASSAENMQAPDVDAQVTKAVSHKKFPTVITSVKNEGTSVDLAAEARAALKAGRRPW